VDKCGRLASASHGEMGKDLEVASLRAPHPAVIGMRLGLLRHNPNHPCLWLEKVWTIGLSSAVGKNDKAIIEPGWLVWALAALIRLPPKPTFPNPPVVFQNTMMILWLFLRSAVLHRSVLVKDAAEVEGRVVLGGAYSWRQLGPD